MKLRSPLLVLVLLALVHGYIEQLIMYFLEALIFFRTAKGPFLNYVRVNWWVGGTALCSKTLTFYCYQG